MSKPRICPKHPELGEITGKCKLCNREYQATWYKNNKEVHVQRSKKANKKVRDRNREFVLDYLLGHPCLDCGETDPIVLEFDHLRDKTMVISVMVANSYSIERIKEEIDKCEVVCANCHKHRTAKRSNSFKYKRSSFNG